MNSRPISLRATMPPGVGALPELHRLWATFLDPDLEREFRKETFALSVRRYVRFSVTLSVVAFLAYGVHDALVVPEIRDTAWFIRYALFGPFAALLVAFVWKNRDVERHQPAMLAFGLAVNAVVVTIGALARGTPGYFVYTSYAVVFVTLGPFLARMNVKTQAAYTLLTIAMYDAADVAAAHAPPVVRLSWNLTLLTLGSIGTLAAHQSELQAHLTFLQRRVIRDQMAALDVERQRSEGLLLNVLPKRIADRLKGGAVVIADRFDEATVLFSDIVGFTELSARLPPEELVRRLDTVFSKFDAIAGELQLEKIKTIGDAYMVCGGVPVPRADHAEAVCEMALRMRDALDELGDALGAPLEVRIGVHTGSVVAGVIGTKKFIYDVWGDTVNIASRMESHGVPSKIQVSEAVRDAVKGSFELEPRGAIAVKGKGEMQTYFLVGRRSHEDRAAALPEARS